MNNKKKCAHLKTQLLSRTHHDELNKGIHGGKQLCCSEYHWSFYSNVYQKATEFWLKGKIQRCFRQAGRQKLSWTIGSRRQARYLPSNISFSTAPECFITSSEYEMVQSYIVVSSWNVLHFAMPMTNKSAMSGCPTHTSEYLTELTIIDSCLLWTLCMQRYSTVCEVI